MQQARLLDAIELTDLQSRPLTYAEVGATATSMPSDGYHRFTRRRTLGPTTLDQAAEALMSWQLHLRAGVRVAASSLTVQPETVVNLHVGFGPWSAAAPCRVVYIVNEQDRRGFAYGTLRGHPESGEELFVLHSDSTGTVQITISAFSRHASLLSRAAGPAARIVQHSVTTRYLRALG